MSQTESLIRITLAVIVFILWLFDVISGVWLIILSIFAVLSVATAFVNFCPLYRILGLSTIKCVENAAKAEEKLNIQG